VGALRRTPPYAVVALALLVLAGCGGGDEDTRTRALDALAGVPIADAYALRVALREPGGRRRILKLTVDARESPRPSGTWRATYEVDLAGEEPYVVESGARQDVISVSVGRSGRPVPASVGRPVTFASKRPRRVLDSRFVLAPYDRSTLDPSLWPQRLEPVAGPDADTDRLEGPADAQVLLDDARDLLESVAGPDPAGRDAAAQGAEMAVDVDPGGRLERLVARGRITGGGRVSVELTARPTARGGLETVRARPGVSLRRLPAAMRGAVPPRVRDAIGVDEPGGG